MVGVDLPIVTHPLQALVTERLKPFLHHVVVSATLHVYINQTDRGEVVIGEEIDPYSSYSMRSTLRFLENAAAHTLELFPFLQAPEECVHDRSVLRRWPTLARLLLLHLANLSPLPVLYPLGARVDIFHASHQLLHPPRNMHEILRQTHTRCAPIGRSASRKNP